MDDHTTLTVHIDTTALPDGYDKAIRAAITTTTGRVLPDIDLTMLVLTNVTVGAAARVAAALVELMDAGPTPAQRFAFTVGEEPVFEWPGQILRYTPDTGLVSDRWDGDEQSFTTAAGISGAVTRSAGAADLPDTGTADLPPVEFDPVAHHGGPVAGAAGEAGIDNGSHRTDPTVAPAGIVPSVPAPPGPPSIVNGCPVVAAVADTEDTGSWIVICRRTERLPAWAADTSWYVTWRTWWDGWRWTGEHGDYGPHHGLTWPQAQQSLARRLELPPAHPVADPRVYLEFGDHTDTWNCPSCRQPITEVYDCRTLGALQTAITGHRCPPADDAGTTEPQPASATN